MEIEIKTAEKQQETARKVPGRPFPKGVSGNPKGRRKKTELDKVVDDIKKSTKEAVIAYLESKSLGAAKRIEELSKKATTEKVKLSANQDILDRAGVIGKGQPGGVPQLNQIILNINSILEDDGDRES